MGHRITHPKLMVAMLAFMACMLAQTALADEAAWRALKSGGAVVLLRHGVTEPGIGDPPNFTIGKCETQRNLSAQGRRDAQRIGETFRRRSIAVAEVLSSRWCRCIDTATLAFGRATPSAMLDSMFNDDDQARASKLRMVRDAVAKWKGAGNLLLVTHQQNILAMVDASPSSGEMIVTRPDSDGNLRVVGRIGPSEY